jgi:hypothetical protein
MAGSITPASKLLRTVPFKRSSPMLQKCHKDSASKHPKTIKKRKGETKEK